jgi:hypothetical protein
MSIVLLTRLPLLEVGLDFFRGLAVLFSEGFERLMFPKRV